MTLVRFAIDEKGFLLGALSADQASDIIRSLLWSMRDLDAAGHDICFDPDLIQQEIWGGVSFWELFYSSDLSLSIEDLELAAAQFGKAARWDELGEPQPDEVEVRVGQGAAETSGPIAWALAQAPKKIASAACISSSANREMGLNSVTNSDVARDLWFVENAQQVREFFRHLAASYAQTPDDIEALSPYAFPDLDFGAKCFGGIKAMSKPVTQLAPTIVLHLGILSDHGHTIFSENWQNAAAQFGSRGVDISDENGNTKQNAIARRQRTVLSAEGERICWWHTKLEPDRDRIHLDPSAIQRGQKIFVGIFCRHLDT